MKKILEKNSDPGVTCSKKDPFVDCKSKKCTGSVSSETEPSVSSSKNQKPVICWEIRPLGLHIFRNLSNNSGKRESKNCGSNSIARKKSSGGKNHYERWKSSVRRVMMMNTESMRRILGFNRTGVSASNSDIWLLGILYRVSQEGESASDPTHSEGFAAFVEDFSSRIWITYRKGFAPIADTKYSSDVYWGCMLRSSQMLVSQAFLFHKLGRSWRKYPHMPLDQTYIDILHLFGDAEDSPFSIHNLLQAGKPYGLAPGSWVGPYAMCRTWESLVRNKREENNNGLSSMMAVYVVSGDEDGERGGAPVLCIEDISKYCSEFGGGQDDWPPILLMVPLVLGLEKVNPRYLPHLSTTFTFPQSLGVLGGKPGASTYIIGVQDEKAFYLDPHEVQQVVQIKKDGVDADTSSYHCNVVRHIPLDSIDSSLAIGFYCRDKSDFDNFCFRASELINQSNGTPLFTITETRSSKNPASYCEHATRTQEFDTINNVPTEEVGNSEQDDEWQLL